MYKRKAVASEETIFSGKLHESRYLSQIDRRCEGGKLIDISFMMNFFGHLYSCLMVQRLGSLLADSVPYYPNMMRLFYSGIPPVGKELNITTFVKGKRIVVKPDDVANVLEMDAGGADILDNGMSSTVEGYNRLEAMNLVSNKVFTVASRLKTSDLKLESRLLHWIVIHAIYPKFGSFTEVGSFELLIMWMILTQRRINLPALILRKMRACCTQTGPLCYGMILTRLFTFFEISMEDEITSRLLPTDTLNEKTLSRMGYFKENEVWKAKSKKGKAPVEEEEESERVPLEHEAGPSGTAPSVDNITRALERLEQRIDDRFDAIERRFDDRFNSVDDKLEDIYRRFGD